MTKVMIGGVKRPEDAAMVTAAGADAVGFVVEMEPNSPGAVTLTAARHIIRAMKPYTASVISIHNADPQEVIDLTASIKASTVHLYGELPLRGIEVVKRQLSHIKVLKAFEIEDETVIPKALAYAHSLWLDGIVLDSHNRTTGEAGGSDQVHNWQISQKIRQETSLPVTLAGGLTPENVGEAVACVQPYALDVNSGVNGPAGFKDRRKVEAFIANVRQAAIG